MSYQLVVGDGAIIIMSAETASGGGPVDPGNPVITGDQPKAEKKQGYPEMRGLLCISSDKITPEMGVHANELEQ